MGKYSKFFVAAAGALAQAVAVTADGEFSLNDGFAIALAALTALGVYGVRNAPTTNPHVG
jgi:hypothetical protein